MIESRLSYNGVHCKNLRNKPVSNNQDNLTKSTTEAMKNILKISKFFHRFLKFHESTITISIYGLGK